MHLVDGVVSTPVLAVSTAIAIGGVAIGLRHLTPSRIPTAAMTAAVFFVASLIHVPLGPSSVHLILGGLAGWLLGWAAAPALFVALLLQSVFFGFGGLTVLGVNTLMLAGPSIALGLLARSQAVRLSSSSTGVPYGLFPLAFVVGSFSVLGSAGLCAAVLALSGEAFLPLARVLMVAHLPIAIIEGLVTLGVTAFMIRVRPHALLLVSSP